MRDVVRRSSAVKSVERLSASSLRHHEVQIVHADWSRTRRREACGDEQVHNVLDSHVTVPVEMGQ